ncbi:MAG: cbb3-type cytochrome oxidase assembly protein CcoS [Bacteroidota bacterium]
MSALFLLIGISLSIAVVFLIACIKAIRSGQYDDDYTPSVRMLFDEDVKQPDEQNK